MLNREAGMLVFDADRGFAFQLIMLALSCFAGARLLLRPPPRALSSGTPHGISLIAFVLVGLYVLVTIAAPSGAGPAALSVRLIQFACLECVLLSGMVVLALEIPRLLHDPETATFKAPPAPEISEPVAEAQRVMETPTEPLPSQAVETPPPTPMSREIWFGLLVGLAALLPTTLIGALRSLMTEEETLHPYLVLLRETPSAVVWIVLAAVVCAPIKEELMFRVVLHGWLYDRWRTVGAVAAAVAFAAMHSLSDAPLLMPLALMLGALYEWRRSLIAACAAHAAFNAANILMVLMLQKP
jgi:membrane protease YdiL (CAAX protease family)